MTDQPLTRELVIRVTEAEYQAISELAALRDITPDQFIDLCMSEFLPPMVALMAKHTRKH